MLSPRSDVVSSPSIVSISGTAEARYLKLKACSEVSSVVTGCRKVSVRAGKLCEEQRKRVLAG